MIRYNELIKKYNRLIEYAMNCAINNLEFDFENGVYESFYTLEDLKLALNNLYKYHMDEEKEYVLTEYLWHIMYQFLEIYVFSEEQFEEIIEYVFWDTDFLFDEDTFNKLSKQDKKRMGFGKGIEGVVRKMQPHPDELIGRETIIPKSRN